MSSAKNNARRRQLGNYNLLKQDMFELLQIITSLQQPYPNLTPFVNKILIEIERVRRRKNICGRILARSKQCSWSFITLCFVFRNCLSTPHKALVARA